MNLTKITTILQTPTFKKAVKKLHANQKRDLDTAIQQLIQAPESGEKKKGDLSFLRVLKIKLVKQTMLLGYSYQSGTVVLELLMLAPHENFYRDIRLLTYE